MTAAPPPAGAFTSELVVDAARLGTVIEHVSNVEYVRWIDLAAERHTDALGWTRAALLERGLMFFVGRHEIDYLAETFLGDELVLATWIERLGRAGHERATRILRRAEGGDLEAVCAARTRWVLVDLDARRPVRMPADVTRALAAGVLETPVEATAP